MFYAGRAGACPREAMDNLLRTMRFRFWAMAGSEPEGTQPQSSHSRGAWTLHVTCPTRAPLMIAGRQAASPNSVKYDGIGARWAG